MMAKMMPPVTMVSAMAITGDRKVIRREASPRFSSMNRMGRSFLAFMGARHQETNFLERDAACRVRFGKLAPRNDRYPVSNLENLVQVLANHQNRRALPRKIDDRLADGG